MSFTSAALAYRESIVVAEAYQVVGNWDAARNAVVRENLLQMRTLNASKRVCTEVISRLKLLTPMQLEIVLEGTRTEQNYALWLAICKRYRFIYDFAVEVLREKYLRFNLELIPGDYDAFFNAKAEWHPEVDRFSDTSRNQQRRFLYRMLREAGLVSRENYILPALLTPRLAMAIKEDGLVYLTLYPVSDIDIQEWIK